MSSSQSRHVEIFAPAKINLFLHILGKRSDGYHELDSLITFADIGDRLTIHPADQFTFKTCGAFARAFKTADKDSSPLSKNLAVRAAINLAERTGHKAKIEILLEKTLPLSSGIGGGSADAAACIWGLLQFWNLSPHDIKGLDQMLLQLGADVPACFYSNSAHMQGIGEKLTPYNDFPEIPAVLINPGKSCSTKDIFMSRPAQYSEGIRLPDRIDNLDTLCDFLKTTGNDLQRTAEQYVPEITNAISALDNSPSCLLARLSGSGATTFGLFANEESAKQATRQIAEDNHDWWVRFTWLNRLHRY